MLNLVTVRALAGNLRYLFSLQTCVAHLIQVGSKKRATSMGS